MTERQRNVIVFGLMLIAAFVLPQTMLWRWLVGSSCLGVAGGMCFHD